MKINLKESFTSVFNEPNWIKKFAIGALFVSLFQLINVGLADYALKVQQAHTEVLLSKLGYQIIGAAFLLTILASLFYLVLLGYIIQYVHNKILDVDSSLPEWKNYFKQGLGSFSISLFYALVVLVPVMALHLNKQSMMILAFILLFLLSPFFSFAMILYAKNLKLNDAFDFKTIFSIFRRVIKASYLYSLIILAFMLWTASYDVIKLIPINYMFKIPFVLCFGFVDFWLRLVSVNIFVQIYKLSESRNAESLSNFVQ
jgi:hypothetical protein